MTAFIFLFPPPPAFWSALLSAVHSWEMPGKNTYPQTISNQDYPARHGGGTRKVCLADRHTGRKYSPRRHQSNPHKPKIFYGWSGRVAFVTVNLDWLTPRSSAIFHCGSFMPRRNPFNRGAIILLLTESPPSLQRMAYSGHKVNAE